MPERSEPDQFVPCKMLSYWSIRSERQETDPTNFSVVGKSGGGRSIGKSPELSTKENGCVISTNVIYLI